MDIDIGGKSVLITGGTGSIGMSLVEVFSRSHGTVYFQYRSNDARAKELEDKYGAKAVKIDFLTSFELVDLDCDIVVNNAGINISKRLAHETSSADWEDTIRVNLVAPYRIVSKYLPYMIRQRWGRIVNISSIFGLRGTTHNLPYNCSKHGLSGLTKTIAKEYGGYGVTCNEICPGPVESELMDRIALQKERELGVERDEYLSSIRETIPDKRFAWPVEVARLALYLASDHAAHINGATIVIDGGAIP